MATDLFVVPTVTCRLLFVLVILGHDRRRIVHVAVTDRPTAVWTAQQLRNAFPEREAPRYLLHDRDTVFAAVATTLVAVSAAGLQRVLTEYIAYYMASRTHLALEKDAPISRPPMPPSAGRVVATPQVGGLHHRYDRAA